MKEIATRVAVAVIVVGIFEGVQAGSRYLRRKKIANEIKAKAASAAARGR